MKSKNKNKNPIRLFNTNIQFEIFVMFSVSILGMLASFLAHNNVLNYFWDVSTLQYFTEFFSPMAKALNHSEQINYLYSNDTCTYSPMYLGITLLFSKLIPLEGLNFFETELKNYKPSLFLLFLYIIITSLLLCALIENECNNSKMSYLLIAIVFFSSPLIYSLARADMTFFVFILCTYFSMNYNSSKIIYRYVAYIALILAIQIKIYPITLLIVLNSKNKKENLLVSIIGVISIIFPFLFTGGFDSFIHFISNRRQIFLNPQNRTTYNWIHKLIFDNSISIIIWLIILLLILVLLILLFIDSIYSKKQWKIWLSTILIMNLLTIDKSTSNYIYYLIPIIMLFNECKINKVDYFYCFLMMLLVLPLQFLIYGTQFTSITLTNLNMILEYFLAVFICIHYIHNNFCIKIRRTKNEKN